MLLGSFYTGLSGLQSNAVALNVIGNNLANINTTGFKRSQTNFAQIMSNTVRGINGVGNPVQIGLGVRTSEIVAKFEQGSIQTTGIKTHLAIQGEGFFQVAQSGIASYTRSGNFGFDDEGFMVAANGGRVQGFLGTRADGTVDTSGDITDIRLDLGEASPPRATEVVRFISNLSAEAPNGETYSTSIEVFDSKGVPHQLSLTFTRDNTLDLDPVAGDIDPATGAATTVNQVGWTYTFAWDGDATQVTGGLGGAGGTGTGVVRFGEDGKLFSIDNQLLNDPVTGLALSTVNDPMIFINTPGTGAEPLSITWDAVDSPADPTVNPNSSFVTSFGSSFNTGTLFQDGFGSGILQDIDFDQEGIMIGFYDNGLTLELAKIALATFNNKLGLKQVDGGFYLPTAASGPASIDGEGTGGRGSIIASSLESSNVDIAEEFTSLIVHQRGYQSNSRTITTADQLLQEALNLKR